VSKIHLTNTGQAVNFASLNEISCHDKTEPYIVAYCFDQPDARSFGSKFVPEVLSNIDVYTDEFKTVLRFRDNPIVAQILQVTDTLPDNKFIQTDAKMVVGKLDDKTFRGQAYSSLVNYELTTKSDLTAAVNFSSNKLGFDLSLTNQLAGDKADSMLKCESKFSVSFQQIFTVVTSVVLLFIICMCFVK
jgi:hypothetical protein